MTLPDPVSRALRTFLQAFLAVFIPATSVGQFDPGHIYSLTAIESAALAAACAGATALLSFIQNSLEEQGMIKPVLKNKAVPVAKPKPLVIAPITPPTIR